MRGIVSKRKGFTLLEIIIALALSAIILITVSLLYTSTAVYYTKNNRISGGIKEELNKVYSAIEGCCYLANAEGQSLALEQEDVNISGKFYKISTTDTLSGVVRSIEYDITAKQITENGESIAQLRNVSSISFYKNDDGTLLKAKVSYNNDEKTFTESYVFYVITGAIG